MKQRILVSIAVLSVTAFAGTSALRARNERIPPPPILISGGGLPGGDTPWLPDDPYGGGGGGSSGLDNNRDYGFPSSGPPSGGGDVDTQGDGGWDWWNNSDFWGWGSGWWRYPDPVPPGGGSGGETGRDDHDGALLGCRIIVTGGNDSQCQCMQKRIVENGQVVWQDSKATCDIRLPGDEGCRGMNPGEICWHE